MLLLLDAIIYPLPLLHTAPCFSCHISLPLSPYSTLVSIVFAVVIPTSFKILMRILFTLVPMVSHYMLLASAGLREPTFLLLMVT